MVGQLPELPVGMAALAVLGLIIVVAYPVQRFLRPIAWLVPVGAGLAALFVVVALPDELVRLGLGDTMAPWLRIALTAGMLVVVAKVVLLHRHAARAATRQAGPPPPRMLPSQERALADLKALIDDQCRTGAGHVLPVDGRPGDGKSFLLTRLTYDLNRDRKSRYVVVVVDVWQQQTEADLQVEILEALYCHPAYLRRYRWLRVPASFLLAQQLAALRRLRSSLRVKLLNTSQTGVELDLELPTLRWQHHFERVTAALSRRARVVVVLDELDRAVPSVTQAALTLARRSVDVPGVTVVLAYARAQVRYKAFNPLLPSLPDLGSTMEAVLYEHHLRLPSAKTGDGQILSSWQELYKVPAARAAGFLADPGTSPDDPAEARAGRDSTLQSWLRLGVYAQADPVLREQLQTRFEEKYLGAPAITMRGATPDDVAHMVTEFDSTRRLVEQLCAGRIAAAPVPDPPRQQANPEVSQEHPDLGAQLREAVIHGIDRWRHVISQGRRGMASPPVRVLEGYLHRALENAVELKGSNGPPLAPEDVATLVVGVYDMAALLYGGEEHQ